MTLQPGALDDRSNDRALAFGVGLGIAFVLVSFVGRAGGNWENIADHLLFHGWVLLWLMAVGWTVRSLGPLELARFWLFGYFAVAFVVLAIGEATEAQLGEDRELQIALLVPVLEETAKLLPIVLYLVALRPSLTLPTLTDIVAGGFAVGAGFAFREDLVRERVAADGFDTSFWGVAFPTTLYEGPRFIVAHGGWTIVAAVGIGLIVIHRRWWAYLVALVGWLLAIADHAAVNALGDAQDELDALTLDGNLLAGALVVVVVGALIHDAVIMRRAARLDDRFDSWELHGEPTVASVRAALRRRRLLTGARMHAWRDQTRGRVRDRTAMVSRLERR